MSDDSMALPPGKTCKNCAFFRRCTAFLGENIRDNTSCDWAPSRFVLAVTGEIDRAQLEQFCEHVKYNFNLGGNWSPPDAPGRRHFYDKADMLAELTAFLVARGIEVK